MHIYIYIYHWGPNSRWFPVVGDGDEPSSRGLLDPATYGPHPSIHLQPKAGLVGLVFASQKTRCRVLAASGPPPQERQRQQWAWMVNGSVMLSDVKCVHNMLGSNHFF